jgi:hypothetical protein
MGCISRDSHNCFNLGAILWKKDLGIFSENLKIYSLHVAIDRIVKVVATTQNTWIGLE